MQKKVPFNKSATSCDVAKRAGVSQSTVSRVFNNTGIYQVKPALKERVLRAADEIGYRPNLVARGMISGKTNVIGLVVGDSLGPFYNLIINSFAEKIQAIGKQCLIFKVPRQEQLGGIIDRVMQFQVEAMVITASAITKVIAESILDNNIPVVLFNRFIPDLDISMVYTDPVEGASQVAQYLYDEGHRDFGYIKFEKETSEEAEKKIGFFSKLSQYGLSKIEIESSGYDYEEGYEAGKRILSVTKPPTAIFCTSDLIALGVMDAAKNEFGIKVPEELAIVGYDDIEMASWKAYELTSVHQPVDELISRTVEIIEKLLEGKKETYIEMVRPILIKRKTV